MKYLLLLSIFLTGCCCCEFRSNRPFKNEQCCCLVCKCENCKCVVEDCEKCNGCTQTPDCKK